MTNRKFGVDCCYVCGFRTGKFLCKNKLLCELCFEDSNGGKYLFLRKICGRTEDGDWFPLAFLKLVGICLLALSITGIFLYIFVNYIQEKPPTKEQRYELLYKHCFELTKNDDFCTTEAYRKVYIHNK